MRLLTPTEWDRLYDEYEAACAELEGASASIRASVRAGQPASAEQHEARQSATERLDEIRRKLTLAHVCPLKPQVEEPKYSVPERGSASGKPTTKRDIKFDDKGNAVLE